jgi:arabinofuranosyltransferase
LIRKLAPEFVVLILAIAGAAIACLFLGRFAFDDLYISFRYAENLASGNGLAWNVGGDPVEGYTNFLLVLILAVIHWIGLSPLHSTQILNLLLVIITSYFAAKLVRGLLPSANAANSNVATMLLGIAILANPYTWQNALSGLETTLFSCILVVTLYALQKAETSGRYYLVFALCTLLTLTRPDGVLFGALTSVVLLLSRAKKRHVIIASLIGFILPVALYEAWRMVYFGQLLPNTFYVKVGESFASLPGRSYVKSFLLTQLALLAMLALGVWKLKRSSTLIIALVWCVGLTAFYLLVQPIQGFYFRFLYSVLVVASVLAVASLVGYASGLKETYRWVLTTVVLTAHLLINWSQAKGEEIQAVIPEATAMYREMGEMLRTSPYAQSLSFAYQDAGVVPYYSKMAHIDLVGLNDERIARASNAGQVLSYLEQQKPSILLLPMERPGEGDSCWTIFRQGHGKMAELGPALVASRMPDRYELAGRYLYIGYDILAYVRRGERYSLSTSSHIRQYPYKELVFAGPVPCVR